MMRTVYLIIATLLLLSAVALATQDITPSTLDAFSISPVSIDTSNGDRAVTVTMTISDALSGFERGMLCIGSPGPCEPKFLYFGANERTAGSAYSGTYAVPVSWPQYSCTGAWFISAVLLVDRVGNNTSTTNPYKRGDPIFGAYTTVRLY